MEKETKNKNIFENSILNLMFKASPERLKGHYWTAVLAKMLYFLPFFILAIIPVIFYSNVRELWIVSLLVAFVLTGPMQYGYVRFFNKLTNDEKPSVLSIFCWRTDKHLLALVIGTVLTTAYFLGTILLVVPALILVAMFSLVMFFIDKHEYENLGDALIDSKVRMDGKGVSMLFYKLFFWAIFGLLTVGAIVLASALQTAEFDLSVIITTAIVGVLLLLFLFSVVSAWYHACNQVYFEEVLAYAEEKTKRRELQKRFEESLKKGELKEKTAEVKEPAKKAPAKKAPAKSTAAKKPAAKKTTTTAKKTTTTKPKTTTKK